MSNRLSQRGVSSCGQSALPPNRVQGVAASPAIAFKQKLPVQSGVASCDFPHGLRAGHAARHLRFNLGIETGFRGFLFLLHCGVFLCENGGEIKPRPARLWPATALTTRDGKKFLLVAR